MVDYERSLMIYTDVYGGSTSFDTITQQVPVKPTITSFEPVSMETSIDADEEMTVVNILVPTGVASVISDYEDDYYSRSSTEYCKYLPVCPMRSILRLRHR